MTTALTALFTTCTIGTMALRNRLNMAPMGTNYSTWNGVVTDRLVDYYGENTLFGHIRDCNGILPTHAHAQ